ncbi:hypothetical protein LAZ67_22002212 [Cordylochernes scorpioides]|uniref:Uncharacterized protein n=1 Tax=Cordylochernes scorpioides TaxID=51811 RepID=A0ABY6LPF3_9ARAC|nr:hypothetical protein LAZ67_22002212 [Cordylochernes scorpioides]
MQIKRCEETDVRVVCADKADIRLSITPLSGSLALGGDETPAGAATPGLGEEEEETWGPVSAPEPPDGGWGWVIVTASFLSNVVVDGIAYTFGLFLPEFVRYYGASTGTVAWVGSLLTGCYLSVGTCIYLLALATSLDVYLPGYVTTVSIYLLALATSLWLPLCGYVVLYLPPGSSYLSVGTWCCIYLLALATSLWLPLCGYVVLYLPPGSSYLSVGTCPLVSALTNRFGCRPVSIAGSVIACVSFLLSTLAPSVDVLMVTYGILGGKTLCIGLGLIYLPAIVSVGYYFSTKRALATGIAVCGSGVGAFVFAPACQMLLQVFDWKGSLIILAGLNLNCAVFGALMRPLRVTEVMGPHTKPLLQRIAEEKERRRNDSIFTSQYTIVQHDDGTMEKKPKENLNMEPGVHSTFFLDQFGKSPGQDTPVMTLSPIEEAKKSPEGSRDEDMEDDMSGSTTTLQNHATSAPIPIPTALCNRQPPSPCSSNFSLPPAPPHASSAPNPTVASGRLSVTPLPAIREIARRKGLVPATQPQGALKISASNITVNHDVRKPSLTMKLSASGYLGSGGQQNNNYLLEEVWKNIREENALDGSRRSSLRRLSMRRDSSKKDLARPLYRKDIFYSGSIAHLPEFINSQKDVRSYVASVISIPREPADIVDFPSVEKPRKDYCPCIKLPKSMTDTVKEMLDMSLLKDRVFLLICVSNVVGMLGFNVPFMYIPECAGLRGVDKNSAAFLLSVIGITNTLGRVLVGWLADRPGVSALLLNNVSIIICGFLVALVPLCQTYIAFVSLCVLFGLFVSAYICLTSIILVELLGLDKLTNAFGLLSLFRGASCMVGPPLAGKLRPLLKDVGNIFLGWCVDDLDKSIAANASDVMPFDVNMLSSGMINRISRQLLSTLVIRLQNSRSIQQFTKSHLVQQRSKVDCLLSCFTKCDVLRFCARKSDSLLLLRFPGYWTSCQKINNSRMRFSIHEVSTPISVDITMKSLIRFPVGSLFDATGSYLLPFCLSGLLLVISAVMLFFVPCVQRAQAASANAQPEEANV